MATRTQLQPNGCERRDTGGVCIHEHNFADAYERQRQRILGLCHWMTPDTAAARQLALRVFVEAWARPHADVEGIDESDRLAAAFATHFRDLFRAGRHPPAGTGASADGHAPASTCAAVCALPEPERLLYLLHDREGYAPTTLAAWLNLDAARCAHLIHHARQRLRRALRAAA